MEKIDLKKSLKRLYKPLSKDVTIVDVPPMNFLMIDGQGNPNTSREFSDAVETLFSLAFNIKFALKKSSGFDYVVPPLEGLWWSDDMSDFHARNKDNWKWTLMIMQPPQVTAGDVASSMETVAKKKNPPALEKIRFGEFDEGLSAQMMHIGSFDTEADNIETIHRHIVDNGYANRGKHHEIYLSDFRKTAPEKLKLCSDSRFQKLNYE